tara:strand:- start:2743 stop:3798 length:1056 start_codon:yes stop_codon:yes gene_type:complete
MKINSKKLLAGLKKLSGAINNPSTPILANVRIIAFDNKAQLMGTNLVQSIKVTIPCDVPLEFDTTINYKKLTAICSQLADHILSLTVKDDVASLKCNKSKFKLSCISSNQWPDPNLLDNAVEIFFDNQVFSKEISNVFYAASKDESRPILNGVLIDAKSDSLRLVTTDGKRLAMSEVINVSQNNIKAVVPVNVLIDIAKNSYGDIKITIDNSYISAESGDYAIISKLIEGNYPDYSQIMPDSFKSHVSINKYDLLNAVQRVSLILDNVTECVTLKFKDNSLTVSAHTQDSAVEKITIDFNGDIELNYNPVFLVDALKNSSGDFIELNYNDSTAPTQITCENLEYLVMPMRG